MTFQKRGRENAVAAAEIGDVRHVAGGRLNDAHHDVDLLGGERNRAPHPGEILVHQRFGLPDIA